DRVVRENGIVREQAYGVAGSVDFAAGEGNALGVETVRAAQRREAAVVRVGDPLSLGPAVDVLRRGDDGRFENDVGGRQRRSLILDDDRAVLSQALNREMLK